MNTANLKHVDTWLGPIIIALVLSIKACCGLFRKRTIAGQGPSSEIKQLTIIKILGLGSLLHLAPVLAQLKKERPDVRLDIITAASNRELLDYFPQVDRVFCLSINRPGQLVRDCYAIFRHYRHAPAVELYDAEFLTCFSGILAALIGSSCKIGFQGTALRNQIYDHCVRLDETGHIQSDFQCLLGLEQQPLEPVPFRIREKEHKQIVGAESGHAAVGVNVHVSSIAYERRWPLEQFQRLLEYCHQRYPAVEFIFTGLEHETPRVVEFVNRLGPSLKGQCRIMSGGTSLAELIKLLGQMKLFISADSGPLTLAVYLDIPTVSFWGPETPQRYGPRFNPEKHSVFDLHLQCSPCLLARNNKTPPCRGRNICMTGLTAELVIGQLEQTGFLERHLG